MAAVEPAGRAAGNQGAAANFHAILSAHADTQPDVAAIVRDDETLTYPQFLDGVTQFARWLLDNGLDGTTSAGISVRDDTQHLFCSAALLCLGVPQVNLPTHEIDANKRSIFAKVGGTQLIAERHCGWAEHARQLIAPAGMSSARGNLDLPAANWADFPLEADAVFRTTSGSTGVPKTFGLTAERLMLSANRLANDPWERSVLRFNSIEFDSTRLHRIMALVAGNTCVFTKDARPDALAAVCARAAVTEVDMGPTRLRQFLRSGTAQPLPASTRLMTGGSRVPGALRQEARVLTDNLWVSYATSEVGVISVARPEQHRDFPEGIGDPLPGVSVEIVDEAGNTAAPGEIGRARVAKAGTTRGYLGEPDNQGQFRNGWFQTGDLLSHSDGGPLVFHARADDVMILNGIKIFPSAIEDALTSHPDILEAIAYPVASHIHGDIPVADVVLAGDAAKHESDDFVDYCRGILGVQAPRRVFIVDDLARGEPGKPRRPR